MSSDFVFIDPNKIPPRRSIKPTRFGRFKAKKIASKVWEKDSYEEEYKTEEDVPEFSLLDNVLPETNIAVQASSIDPLSQAIFTPERVSFFVNKNYTVPILKKEVKTQEDVRKEILAELESIYTKDEVLSKRINEMSSTSRSTPIHLVSSSFLNKDFDDGNLKIHITPKQDFNNNFDDNEEEHFLPTNLTVKKDLTDKYRAESDWFQVSLAAPAKILELRKYSENKNDFKGNTLRMELPKKRDGIGLKTFLFSISLFSISVFFGYFLFSENSFLANFVSGGEGLVKTAFGGVNSKLLSTSSFTLVNSKESDIFPHLAEFNSQIKVVGLGKELSDNIEGFLQKNSDFSWFNIFKKKSGGGVFSIANVEDLNKVKIALNTLSSTNKNLIRLSSEFSNYTSILTFWNQIFLPDKNYLIVVLNQDRSWPGGGEPKNYVVVHTSKEGVETVVSGKFSELDAAFNLKVVPPDPIKMASTSWLPSQSFWFMDFKESAKTIVNFFENTTNKKIDGVMAVSENFLKDLSFKESLTLDTSSTSWFYSFYDSFSRKPAGRWVSLSNILSEGLNSHAVQLYFKDLNLENFVEGSGWSTKTSEASGKDLLGVSWASIKGEALNLELAEYRTQIFQDGSVMVKLNLMMRQNIGDESLNYLKIYLPKGFQLLKAEGFSAKEKIPEFNYSANGFSSDKRIKESADSKFSDIDLFEEGDDSVIGGWVKLKRNERNTISLEYISGTKISRSDGSGSYGLKIIRPSQKENTPFRYVVTPQEGVKITSLAPNGFVTENMGEYQGNISQDLNLTSSFLFGK
ncbi:MAG: DUF4012 domain-containing protein [Patescibacteria group bacterium]